jgi:hypothetical protein
VVAWFVGRGEVVVGLDGVVFEAIDLGFEAEGVVGEVEVRWEVWVDVGRVFDGPVDDGEAVVGF